MIINTFRVFTLLFLLLSLNVIVATADDDHDIKDNEFGEEWNSCSKCCFSFLFLCKKT